MTLTKNFQSLAGQLFRWGLVFFGAFIFLLPAIWNGFPFIFTDTLSYMVSGFDLIAPPDRPIFYGIYVRVTNLFFDIWGEVICQAILLSFLLIKFAKKLFPSLSLLSLYLWLLLIAFFTSAPWFVGQISPDIFSAILFLALMIWALSYNEASIFESVLVCSVLILSICVHSSNLLICAFTALMFVIWLLIKRESWKSVRKFSLTIISSISISVVLIISSNVWSHYGVTLNPSGKAFILARLLEDGSGFKYLKKTCETSSLRMCASLGILEEARKIEEDGNPDESPELRNLVASSFLYGGGINASGGIGVVVKEAGVIINGTIMNFPFDQLVASLKNVGSQLKSFSVGEQLNSTLKVEPINYLFSSKFPKTYESYLQSRQSVGGLSEMLAITNFTYRIIVILSIVGIIIAYIFFAIKGIYIENFQSVIYLMAVFLVINAAVTGALSGVFDRYQGRVIWIMPAIAILFSLAILNLRYSRFYKEREL